MDNKELIKKILDIAVYAPSGENSQPWKFKVSGGDIFILNNDESDTSLYNYNQRGTFVAHGALIENIIMLASDFGCNTNIDIFPDKKDLNIIARIELLGGEAVGMDNIAEHIKNRSTNRKPYKPIKLSDEQLNKLLSLASEFNDAKLLFVDDKIKIQSLSKAASVNERVMLSNRQIHNFFFKHINWTLKEENSKKMGFYIKTLELPAPARIMMRVFKKWGIMNLFNKIGLEKIIAISNAKNYSNAAAMGIIVLSDNSPDKFILAGRLLQKVWVNATKMGLSMQPMTGALFFMESILAGAKNQFSDEQIRLIDEAVKIIKKNFDINDDKTATMMFRIGYANPPSARSAKMSPVIVFED